MIKYILKRLLAGVLTIIVLITIAFFLMQSSLLLVILTKVFMALIEYRKISRDAN